ncbi:MAG: UvrB/UvrC motif-containing protein [Planctomycetes bacterium]|nr:UvrB/UvrC motif-containing protein [Planctomycetota bacterium]MCB9904642.1 UvrB/UvrC motif-containing protein [Planctomycetota bacterium]
MNCEHCHKNEATVHVTDIAEDPSGAVEEHHYCELCADGMNLLFAGASKKKSMADIWKLLQISAKQSSSQRAQKTCDGCGLTLDEFRRRGRLGCASCYETFADHICELLERVHGSTQHIGRLPGVSEAEWNRMQDLAELRQELEVAIREEAYENAARLRDKIQHLEADGD